MKIATRLVEWQKQYGRHGLPWQSTRDPYRVWLSEIMLQQTQVATVLPYYATFLSAFPNVTALAQAPEQKVMSLWAGLGYYARARNLHACAKAVVQHWGGSFPNTAAALATLPGIGPSTAAAIAAFCFGERISILDGNVKRVLARYFAIEGDPSKKAVETQLWDKARKEVPSEAQARKDPLIMTPYTQGLMDLGATVCTRNKPDCRRCPLQKGCEAYRQGRTQEFPTAKARKVLPEKSTTMLIVHCKGKLMLEQRPLQGIWGGLWSLPELSSETNSQQYFVSKNIAIKEPQKLASFVHAFTHFKLIIHPVLIEAKKNHSSWVKVYDIAQYGLPTPVKKILTGLIDQNLI